MLVYRRVSKKNSWSKIHKKATAAAVSSGSPRRARGVAWGNSGQWWDTFADSRSCTWFHTVDGSEIRLLPLEVGSLRHELYVFFTSQVVVWDFWTINSMNHWSHWCLSYGKQKEEGRGPKTKFDTHDARRVYEEKVGWKEDAKRTYQFQMSVCVLFSVCSGLFLGFLIVLLACLLLRLHPRVHDRGACIPAKIMLRFIVVIFAPSILRPRHMFHVLQLLRIVLDLGCTTSSTWLPYHSWPSKNSSP